MKFLSALVLFFIVASSAHSNQSEICAIVDGAKIIAQDNENTYLGKISNQYDSDSIFNKFGTYGSEYSASSVWNKFAIFGSEYSNYSSNSPYTSTPPMIIKNGSIVGYLSSNKLIKQSISLNFLNAMCNE
jgi:hypothetical protein